MVNAVTDTHEFEFEFEFNVVYPVTGKAIRTPPPFF
jgi:hypothetical protein